MKPREQTSDSKEGDSPAPAASSSSASAVASPGGAPSAEHPSKSKRDRKRFAASSSHEVREYTRGEEIANAVSHGVGALLSIAALVLLIVFSVLDGGGVLLAGALVYGISMLLEYVMSTLYHALTNDAAKRVFKVLDHCCIYLFIAGTYTPFCLVTLANNGGGYLCAFVWAVSVAGVAAEAFWTFRPRWVSAVIYVLLGWAVVWFIPALFAALPTVAFVLLAVGGACYTVGAVFYLLKKVPYMHFVFHLLVLAGSIFQFFVVLLFVV